MRGKNVRQWGIWDEKMCGSGKSSPGSPVYRVFCFTYWAILHLLHIVLYLNMWSSNTLLVCGQLCMRKLQCFQCTRLKWLITILLGPQIKPSWLFANVQYMKFLFSWYMYMYDSAKFDHTCYSIGEKHWIYSVGRLDLHTNSPSPHPTHTLYVMTPSHLKWKISRKSI
jgi:hypothetical protein